MSGGDCNDACETPVFDDPDIAIVLRGGVSDLQRAAESLAANGITSEIVKATEEDGGGCCREAIYLVVAREDAPSSFAVFEADWKRGLTDEQAAALEAASAIVVDPDAAETTCPACLTTFAALLAECPDCGLVLG
ncbi:MAG TPA: hypothetical protein VGK20_09345 [Candidatus Binatia bacterium]